MAGLDTYLYPPIINSTYLPGFIVNSRSFQIFFNISNYNDLDSIKSIHVSIRDQRTNRSLKTKNPGYIQLVFGSEQQKAQKIQGSSNLYGITIETKNFETKFQANLFYKVQLRFSSEYGSTDTANFSQWSEVALIKVVNDFDISVSALDKNGDTKQLTSFLNLISGRIEFNNGQTNQSSNQEEIQPLEYNQNFEYLDKFRIQLKQDDELIQDSGVISNSTTVATNQFKYRLKTNLQMNIVYTLVVQVQTTSGILKSSDFKFLIAQVRTAPFRADFFTQSDSEGGRIILNLFIKEQDLLGISSDKFLIKRACSDDNYQQWEVVYDGIIADMHSDITMYEFDYTIQPGKFYKYSFQKAITDVLYFEPIIADNIVSIYPEDIFLIAKNKQLKIKFNPEISNFSYVVSESKQETIGSKYPFIRRNANIGYRTFTLSGLITALSDLRENTMKAYPSANMNQQTLNAYSQLQSHYNVTPFNDFLGERLFREKVMEFLYNNDVKLFKSTAQGDMLVKLMNISLSPLNQIGRLVYSFTCTAYEIDEYNLQNCRKYLIQRDTLIAGEEKDYQYFIGQIFTPYDHLSKTNPNPGKDEHDNEIIASCDNTQFITNWNLTSYQGNTNLVSEMKAKIRSRLSNNEEIQDSSFKVCYLKIELSSRPYPIQYAANSPAVLGYIVIINNNPIIIRENGVYELIDQNTKITSLQFVKASDKSRTTYPRPLVADKNSNKWPVQGAVTFIAKYKAVPKSAEIEKSYHIKDIIGQYYGYYDDSKNILQTIKQSYYKEKRQKNKLKYKQSLDFIRGIRIHAEPGTKVFVREDQDDWEDLHIIGQSGLLEFFDNDTDIRSISFASGQVLTGVKRITTPYYSNQLKRKGQKNYPWYAFTQFYNTYKSNFPSYNFKQKMNLDYIYYDYTKIPTNILINLLKVTKVNEYDSTSTYKEGAYVIKDGRVYKCITAITKKEEWDASKWKKIRIGVFDPYLAVVQIYEIEEYTIKYLDSKGKTDLKKSLRPVYVDSQGIEENDLKTHRFVTDSFIYLWNENLELLEAMGQGDFNQNFLYIIKNPDGNVAYYYYDKKAKQLKAQDQIETVSPDEDTIYRIWNYTEQLTEVQGKQTYHEELFHNGRFCTFIRLPGDQYEIDRYSFDGIIDYYCTLVEREYE